MNVFKIISYFLALAAIIFLFIDWKISIGLFIIGTIFQVIPLGPNALISVVTGYLVFGGIIFIFMNWKVGLSMIVAGFLLAKFRIWGNKVNNNP